MKFPDKPTCHAGDAWAKQNADHLAWRPPLRRDPEGIVYLYRTCGYCGSLHPEDLLAALRDPRTDVGGSDWKYGWPHKFYVAPVNPDADVEVQVGSRSGPGFSEPIMGKRATIHHKFYSEHLRDEGFDAEAFDAVTREIDGRLGILFEMVPDTSGRTRLRYRAPYAGYQR